MKSGLKRTDGRRAYARSKGDPLPQSVERVFRETNYEAPKVISVDSERMLRRSDLVRIASIPQLTMMGNF